MPLRLSADEDNTPKPKREPDRFLLLIKTATILVAAAIVGGLILVLNSGDDPQAEDPAIPEITSTTPRGDRALEPRETTTTPPTTPPTTIAPPETNTATTEIAPPPPPPPPQDPPVVQEPPPANNPGFAVVGQPCEAGSFSITAQYQPVVCNGGTWQPFG
jgi:hypothetical protein